MLSALIATVVLAGQDPAHPLHPLIDLDRGLPSIEDKSRSMEEAIAFVADNGRDDLTWTPPQVEITAREDMSRTALSIAFNWIWITEAGRERRPVWFARLRAMDWDGSIERYADSRTCLGVEQVLSQIDTLPAVQPRTPKLPDRTPTAPVLDLGGYLHDNTYTIRTRGAFTTAYTQRLEVVGGSDTPLAPIVEDALNRLLSCWSDAVPPRS
jgi:hypothetical protein